MQMPYVSPSRLSKYEACPLHQFKPRYVDGVSDPEGLPAAFGKSVHKGIEVAMRAGPWEDVFMRDWFGRHGQLSPEALEEMRGRGRAYYSQRGLELVEAVLAKGFEGTPEVEFETELPGLGVKTYGIIDLSHFTAHVLTDWKTHGMYTGWTQEKADAMTWQPGIYSAVYHKETGTWPRFRYVALPVYGPIKIGVHDATRTPEQVRAVIAKAEEYRAAIARDEYPCWCKPKSPRLLPGTRPA
jgi:hypothetical protein